MKGNMITFNLISNLAFRIMGLFFVKTKRRTSFIVPTRRETSLTGRHKIKFLENRSQSIQSRDSVYNFFMMGHSPACYIHAHVSLNLFTGSREDESL